MGFSRQEYWSGLPFPSRELMWLIVLNCIAKIAFYVKKRIFLPSSLLLDLPPNLGISEGIIPPILFDLGFKMYLFLQSKLEPTRIWRRKWKPTPVFMPGESHGQRSLADCDPWGSQRVRHSWSDLACTKPEITKTINKILNYGRKSNYVTNDKSCVLRW